MYTVYAYFNIDNIDFSSGGTVGLFTGFSLMAIVEIVFWLYRILRIPFLKEMSRKKKNDP